MKKYLFYIVICLGCLYPHFMLRAQGDSKGKNLFDWADTVDVNRPPKHVPVNTLSVIRVRGNVFVNALGDTVVFKGAAIADPDKIAQQGRWNKNLFIKVKEMGVMIVRIPVHPASWRARTPAQYILLLDQAVQWCSELGIYVDIDWHSIGNLGMELFQDPMYNTTQKETYEFWRAMAVHFKGNTTVPFFELFNEPTLADGKLGSMTWSEWKKLNENIINLIRAYDKEKIPIVAGFDWAYDLTPLRNEPIAAEGIAYSVHPYPHKRWPPYELKWEEDFGFASGKYPVVATEFGFILGNQGTEANLNYGNTIIKYFADKGISWITWVFDPDWYPRLVESWDTFKLTESGEFFKQAMQKKR
ncbi:MAG: cellulase family glycosylhydrolase [Bacteroidota bacterium]